MKLRNYLVLAILIGIAGLCAVQYRSMLTLPTTRLALDAEYKFMPADGQHRYINHPLDHKQPSLGSFRGFYILGPDFEPNQPTVFILTDGQMELVDTDPDFAFFDALVAPYQYVLIGRRGHSPTLLPEVYTAQGELDFALAARLYGSEQHIEDIEQVRQHMVDGGLLGQQQKIHLFGASGAGVLAQQYLAQYGQHIDKAILSVTGAPDIAQALNLPYSHNFADFASDIHARFEQLASQLGESKKPNLSYMLYQTARSEANAIMAQDALLTNLEQSNTFGYWKNLANPKQSLPIVSALMRSPASDAVKVRWFELVGQDLIPYLNQNTPHTNLLYGFSKKILSDWVDAYHRGVVTPKKWNIKRDHFEGEVLVTSGSQDVVFSTAFCHELAKAYINAGCIIYQDGHKLQADTERYRLERVAFFDQGLTSPGLQLE